MNFLIKAFLSAVLIFSVFFTVESEKVRGASRKCSRELQEIVYNPKSEKSEYFSRLEKEFRLFSPLLFGSQQSASAAIWSFEDKYNNVLVKVSSPFNEATLYTICPNLAIPNYENNNMYPGTARLALDISELNYESTTQTYYYSFNIWNRDGELLIITFIQSMLPC